MDDEEIEKEKKPKLELEIETPISETKSEKSLAEFLLNYNSDEEYN